MRTPQFQMIFFFHVLSSHSVCEIRLRPLMSWSGYMTSWITSWMQYSVMAKSSKACKSHQPWVAVLVANHREEQEQGTCFSGGPASQTPNSQSLSPSQSQNWRRKETHALKGLNPSLDMSSRGAAHTWVLPQWEMSCSICMCSIDSHPKLHGQGTGDVDKSTPE